MYHVFLENKGEKTGLHTVNPGKDGRATLIQQLILISGLTCVNTHCQLQWDTDWLLRIFYIYSSTHHKDHQCKPEKSPPRGRFLPSFLHLGSGVPVIPFWNDFFWHYEQNNRISFLLDPKLLFLLLTHRMLCFQLKFLRQNYVWQRHGSQTFKKRLAASCSANSCIRL